MEQPPDYEVQIEDETPTPLLCWSLILLGVSMFASMCIGLWTVGGWILEAFK